MSNMKKLFNESLIEMTAEEMEQTRGGIHWIFPSLAFQMVMEIVDGSFFSDIDKGYNQIMK